MRSFHNKKIAFLFWKVNHFAKKNKPSDGNKLFQTRSKYKVRALSAMINCFLRTNQFSAEIEINEAICKREINSFII